MIKRTATFLLMFCSLLAGAQDNGPQMADQMRADGKIYVVVTVIGIIFLAILTFLIYIERHLKKLEDQLANKNRS
jgi:hypothetical protein